MARNDQGARVALDPDPAVGGSDLTGALGELVLAIGHMSEQSRQRHTRPRIPWPACHPVPIRPGVINAATGTIDIPDMLGPHDPYWWDVRRIGAWGFTAGTLTLFLNSTQGEQLAAWTVPGNFTWGTGLLLAPRDRLIFVAAGITGNVQITGQAFEVESPWLPEYLL